MRTENLELTSFYCILHVLIASADMNGRNIEIICKYEPRMQIMPRVTYIHPSEEEKVWCA